MIPASACPPWQTDSNRPNRLESVMKPPALIPEALCTDCFCPIALNDRADAFWQSHQCVPGIAARIDDRLIVLEHLVAQEILPEILPGILDWIEFRRVWRQVQEGQIGWHHQPTAGLMPAGAVQDDHAEGAQRDRPADFG